MGDRRGRILATLKVYVPRVSLYLGLTFLLARLVQDPATHPIDPSFQQTYSYFFLNGTQVGKEYLFTYGPMGHFLVPRYHADLFWLDYFVTLALGLAVAFPVYTFLRSLKGRIWALFSILVPICLTAEVGAGSDIPVLMSSLIMVVLVRDGQASSRWILGVLGTLWAFFSLCKFTLMVLGVGFVGYLGILFLSRREWKDALVLVVSYFVAIPAFWLIARQDLGNFPTFLVDSLEISRAYVLGMWLDDDASMFVFVFVTIGAVYVCTVTALSSLELGRVRMAVDLFFVSVMVVILWRLGLTRNNSHETKFFLPMMLLPYFSCGSAVLTDGRAKRWRIAAGTVLVIGATGYGIADHLDPTDMVKNSVVRSYQSASHILNPIGHRKDLEAKWNHIKLARNLPKIKRTVGSSSIDVFSFEQRLLLFDEYNYRPRYIYQGYQACTADLLERNGASYWGTGPVPPPDFVMYQQLAINHRFPTMEDSQALLALMYCYEPVLEEKTHVLYKRVLEAPSRLPEPTGFEEGTLTLNERFELPDSGDDWQLLSLNFIPSLKAKLRAMPWNKNSFGLHVFYEDGTEEVFVLFPSMTTLPFLLSPDSDTPPVRVDNFSRPMDVTKLGQKVIKSFEVIDRLEHAVASEWEIRYTLTQLPPPPHKTSWPK